MSKHTITLTTNQLVALRSMIVTAATMRCSALHHQFSERHGMAEDCPVEQKLAAQYESLRFLFEPLKRIVNTKTEENL